MNRIWKIVDAFWDWTLALGIAGIALICLAQIVARSIFNASITWSNEASRYLFVYVVFIGAFVLTRDREFICMDLIQSKIPKKARPCYDLLLHLLVMAYAAVMLIFGYKFMVQNSFQRSSSLHIPMNLLYMIMPVSGFFIILYTLRNLAILLKSQKGREGKQ